MFDAHKALVANEMRKRLSIGIHSIEIDAEYPHIFGQLGKAASAAGSAFRNIVPAINSPFHEFNTKVT